MIPKIAPKTMAASRRPRLRLDSRHSGGGQGSGSSSVSTSALFTSTVSSAGSLMSGGTRQLVNTVLQEYARSEPVYRIDSDVLRRLPASKQIGNPQIEDGRVVIPLQ